MKNRGIFIFLILILVFGCVAVGVGIFSRSSTRSSSFQSAQKSHLGDGVKTETSQQGRGNTMEPRIPSIWADSRLRGLSGTGSVGSESSLPKEVEQNLRNLISLYDQGDDTQLLEKLDALISLHPEVKEYLALKGDYLFNEGKWSEAENVIRELISKDSSNSYARTTLAEVLAAQGKFDDALKTQVDVLANDPGNGDALNGILAVTEMQGNGKRGEEIVKTHALANLSNGSAVAPYFDLLKTQGNSEEANRILDQALKLSPTSPDLLQREAVRLIQLGKSQEAMLAADQAAANSVNEELRIISLNVKYQAAYSTRNLPAMEQITEEIRSINPNHESLAHLQETNELIKKN